jgi:hypothetical protein
VDTPTEKVAAAKSASALAAAAWKDLHALTSNYQAAIMRGDEEAAKRIASQAHDLLDVCLDQHSAVARSTLSIIGM